MCTLIVVSCARVGAWVALRRFVCAMAAPEDAASYEWLFEHLLSVFSSPSWEGPLMDFIDDNCVVFDDEDENKVRDSRSRV